MILKFTKTKCRQLTINFVDNYSSKIAHYDEKQESMYEMPPLRNNI